MLKNFTDLSLDGLARAIAGHLLTVAPSVRHQVLPFRTPAAEAWSTAFDDPRSGEVRLHGRHRRLRGVRERDLLVIVHGLGGSPESAYTVTTAAEADALGWPTLRIALRGTGGLGHDFYHAGLTADLHAALADEALAGYERIWVVGYSLGGHLTLKAATEERLDARVQAVASVCAPVDLAAGVAEIDSASKFVYREYILRELRQMWRQLEEGGAELPTPYERVRRVKSLREWDSLTVVPRFGFDDVADYYATQSVAGHIGELRRPALVVYSEHDPMIPAVTIDQMCEQAHDGLHPRRIALGGHVFFPRRVDLGQAGPKRLVAQILRWFDGF